MRSRNVAFSANGLKAATKHYAYLDSGIPDLFPKLIEINMVSGTFSNREPIQVLDATTGRRIARAKLQAPAHKYHDTSPEAVPIGQANGSAEKYQVDPFDRDRPAPSFNYSSTSKLLNIDIIALANDESYSGYVVKGAKIVGEQSGACATVSNVDLISDNWGDILGTFFLRDANQNPQPPVLFYAGTKTFKVTAAPAGTKVLPGSTALASDATATYTATGTILNKKPVLLELEIHPHQLQDQMKLLLVFQ